MIHTVVLSVWLGWVVLNVAALLLAPYVAGRRDWAFTNGLVIVVPDSIKAALTEAELAAIYAHEQGHRAHMHPLRNLARALVFIPRPDDLAARQELQADDYAAARGHGPALASALRKLSTHPFDLARADRLSR